MSQRFCIKSIEELCSKINFRFFWITVFVEETDWIEYIWMTLATMDRKRELLKGGIEHGR